MIDLHSHILHGIDDGAIDIETALDMARWAAEDGVEVMACTPHFLPGVYEPEPAEVIERVAELNGRLMEDGIDLVVVTGCEAHVRPDLVAQLDSRQILPIHTGRYVLCEAPPAVLPPYMEQLFAGMLAAGYKPILAHVERYRWFELGMPWIRRASGSGVLMQVTAGSFFGDYGRLAQDWSMRFLAEGLVNLVASDAHDLTRRPPGLSKAWNLVRSERGEEEARLIFKDLPEKILRGADGTPARVRADLQ